MNFREVQVQITSRIGRSLEFLRTSFYTLRHNFPPKHWLIQFLFVLAVLLGLGGAWLSAQILFLFTFGSLTLGVICTVWTVLAFGIALFLRYHLQKLSQQVSATPDMLIKRHGLRFLFWFVVPS